MKPSVIVCPIHLSRSARSTLLQALTIARTYGAELHVVDLPRSSRSSDTRALPSRDLLLARFRDLVGTANCEGVNVVVDALRGESVEATVEYVRDNSADLVVIGRSDGRAATYRSRSRFANAVAQASNRPTLVLTKDAGDSSYNVPFRTILSAVDFSPASVSGLYQAIALAGGGSRVAALHVLDRVPYQTVYTGSHAYRLVQEYGARVKRTNQDLARLWPPGASHRHQLETLTVSGEADDGILNVATAVNADLIVLGASSRAGFERLMMGSTMNRVVRRAYCPVLIVPAPLDAPALDAVPLLQEPSASGVALAVCAAAAASCRRSSSTVPSQSGTSAR